MVRTAGLTKSYRRGKVVVSALNGVDLSISKGEMVGIVGPSGSGKTTLLNLIGGLDRPSGGNVVIGGTDLNKLNDASLSAYRLHMIGFIFQFYNLVPTLTSVENVELPMDMARTEASERRKRALDLLRTMGMDARADHLPDELSGGEQQRVAVARALANGPGLILGDEPTGDLDSLAARDLMERLDSLRKQDHTTLILVTHDPIVVAKCDRAYSVRDGKILREVSQGEGASDGGRNGLDGLY
jgi:putative ABC transport system ATP-binding protein